jgi:anti-sigma factor RsiW
MTACSDKVALLQGLVDNEVDAVNAAACEAHLKVCKGCHGEYQRFHALRGQLISLQARYRAPAWLHAEVAAAASAQTAARTAAARRDTRRGGWFAGGFGGLLAAGLAVMVVLPQVGQAAIDRQLVASHVRSLLADHLTDVATSNQHVVRPWFNGKVDIAPPVPELAEQGFPLVGGRLDYLDGRVTPAIVYRRRLHTVNLFVLPASGAGFEGTRVSRRGGYSLVEWTQGGLWFAAVSDIDASELRQFREIFQAHAPS